MEKVWSMNLIVIIGALLLVACGQGAATNTATPSANTPTRTASRIHRNDLTKPHVCSRGNTFAYSSTNPNRQTYRQTDCNPCAAANRPAG